MKDEFHNKTKKVKNKSIRRKIEDKQGTLFYSPETHNFGSKRPEKGDGGWRWFTIIALLLPPLMISFISAIHIFEFFQIGNSKILSGMLAGSFEVLTMSALVSLWELRILNRWTIWFLWTMILIVIILMIAGNVFSVWINLNDNLVESVSVLIGKDMGDGVKRLVAIVQGGILPIVSLSFIKILANYLINSRRR